MKIVCGKCSAEVELPKQGEGSDITCPSCGAVFRMPSLADGEELLHPDAFPGYRAVAIVGHGGMGTVYRAIQLSMDREVAIKVLLRKYSDVQRFVSRFEREATALASLNHPNVVAVIDRGREDDLYYLVMEFVHGRTLRYFIKNDLLSVERAIEIAIAVCRALEAAHASGIVHRDIKPGNILGQGDGPVKVADFGIAHMVEENDNSEQERRTRLGTAKYMAPEQRGTGQVIDPRADIYALGVTLFEMLTRTLPKGQPPSTLNKLVPPELDRIVDKALQEDRERRFQSATAMREALEVLLGSMQLEKTPATAILEAPPLPAEPCHACGQPVTAGSEACPYCGAALIEPCYRRDCAGVNPVGAERCGACGGHVEALRRQRRTELEALLGQADAHAAAGAFPEALRALEEAAADPHDEFAALRDRAREATARVRRQRLGRLARSIATVAAALLVVVVAGAGTYWGVVALTASTTSKAEQPDPPDKPQVASRKLQAASSKPQATLRTPHSAFRDYLLALTADGWPQHPPALRLMAACEAGQCLAQTGRDSVAARRLAATLDAMRDGSVAPPATDALTQQLADALDALCGTIAARLGREPLLARSIGRVHDRYVRDRRTAPDARSKLGLASSTLHELVSTAEVTLNPGLDLQARLLFLDASLARATQQDGVRLVADRLARSARLLVRTLRRQDGRRAIPELLDDAAARAARARQAPDDKARLAGAVEALVEALGSTITHP